MLEKKPPVLRGGFFLEIRKMNTTIQIPANQGSLSGFRLLPILIAACSLLFPDTRGMAETAKKGFFHLDIPRSILYMFTGFRVV